MTDRTRVLLVEDNPGDVRLLCEMLREDTSHLFDVTHVDRIGDALRLLAQREQDVVLLDLTLPDGQGLDGVKKITAEATSIPIVVLTAVDDESLAIQAVRNGAQDYLVKGDLESGAHLSRAIRYAIERQRMRVELRSLSMVDDLTGLYNRRGFVALGSQQLKLAQRNKQGSLLFFVDLDGLKKINDNYGHREGDLALIKTAEILKQTFRQSDTIARFGGDEFAILALEALDNSAPKISARLRKQLEGYNTKESSPYGLSLSIGVTVVEPASTHSIEELLRKADKSLYAQKRQGRISR